MELKLLSLTELKHLHKTKMKRDFPPAELKSYASMKRLCQDAEYIPLGAISEEGALQGYALLWGRSDYVLLDYLGVDPEARNQGAGGQILHLLERKFADKKGILVEAEAPDGGREDDLRRRRLQFYQRHGYQNLEYACRLFGVSYCVMLRATQKEATSQEALAAHRALYQSAVPKWIYRSQVHIPWPVPTIS